MRKRTSRCRMGHREKESQPWVELRQKQLVLRQISYFFKILVSCREKPPNPHRRPCFDDNLLGPFRLAWRRVDTEIESHTSSQSVPTPELISSLEKFVAFARPLKGDEKSEGQAFLDHFFRALGHAGVIEVGATFEHRIAKKPGSSQLGVLKGRGRDPQIRRKEVRGPPWPKSVLTEMKSRR